MKPTIRALSALLFTLLCPLAATAQEGGVAPEGYRVVPWGTAVDLPSGGSIVVDDYADDVPFESENVLGVERGTADLWHAEICAGDSDLESIASEVYFLAFRPRKLVWESAQGQGNLHPGIREPRFNDDLLPATVAAGACRDGWVAVAAPDEPRAFPGTTSIGFDPSPLGVVPDELEIKIAWELPAPGD